MGWGGGHGRRCNYAKVDIYMYLKNSKDSGMLLFLKIISVVLNTYMYVSDTIYKNMLT